MLLVVQSYKAKSATLVQIILYVSLIFVFCAIERQFKSSFNLCLDSIKKSRDYREPNKDIKHRQISLRKIKAAFFLKSQGMAKTALKK